MVRKKVSLKSVLTFLAGFSACLVMTSWLRVAQVRDQGGYAIREPREGALSDDGDGRAALAGSRGEDKQLLSGQALTQPAQASKGTPAGPRKKVLAVIGVQVRNSRACGVACSTVHCVRCLQACQ